MASANAESDVQGEDIVNAIKSLQDEQEAAELEQGRVWRRGIATVHSDKQKNTGPVLRTTVKPVKRFRPDSIHEKTNPSPSRKKRIKCTSQSMKAASEDCEGTPKSKVIAASSVCSPEGKTTLENNEAEKSKLQPFGIPVPDGSEAPVKKKRVWEQWSVEDKNYFFEAVSVYGKDFEAIRTAIAHKHRKRGENCVAKTKDQVRHLYYRTWTMISKIIDADSYPSNINKAFQELYAVINYGEIRKRLGGNLKKKGIEKLNELIRDGATSMRVKGKNFRIKTPSCKALKKMNPEYQGKEGINDLPLVSDTRRMKIPLQVTIELYPLTMAAWNQVHSVAHNPRIRIKLSVQCQLSSIFAFLEKKWKPLSTKLIRVGNQCQSKSSMTAKSGKNLGPSVWDRTMVIQTPPDASVNTRIMVFQVTNNKTHCVVSYALRKSLQSREKVAEKQGTPGDEKSPEVTSNGPGKTEITDMHNPDETNGAVSESEVIDSCPSSEEDYDYDSANEGGMKDISTSTEHELHVSKETTPSQMDVESLPKDDFQVQTLSTSFSLNEKENEVLADYTVLENGELVKSVSADVCSSPESKRKKFVTEEGSGLIPSAVVEIEKLESCQAVETMPDKDIGPTEVDEPTKNNETECNDSSKDKVLNVTETKNTSIANCKSDPTRENVAEPKNEKPILHGECSSCHTDSSNDHCDFIELTCKETAISPPPCQAKTSPVVDTGSLGNLDASDDSDSGCKDGTTPYKSESIDEKAKSVEKSSGKKTAKKLILSAKLFGKANAKRKHRTPKRTKGAKAVQSWTAKDCRKTTLAEIYMILGKPSVFRLCYDWIQKSTESNQESEGSELGNEKKTPEVPFCSGLMALIQAAKLTRKSRLQNGDSEKNQNVTQEQLPEPKSSPVPKQTKVKHSAVQCDLLKPTKVDDKQRGTGHSVPTNMASSSNPHGRGISKIVPVDTMLVDGMARIAGFAIPKVPVNRHRKIAVNPAKPVQGTKVSEETMNWLLHRERTRNTTRQVRKPIIVERPLKPKTKPSALRAMKTFSIVTCGPNKIGFLPSQPVFSSRPVLAATNDPEHSKEDTLTTPNSVSPELTPSQTTLNIDDLFKLDVELAKKSDNNSNSSSINPANLLARAAKEAGVAPPTPRKSQQEAGETPPPTPGLEGTMTQVTSPTRSDISVVLTSNSSDTNSTPVLSEMPISVQMNAAQPSNTSDINTVSSQPEVPSITVTNKTTIGKDIALDILKDAFGEKSTEMHVGPENTSLEPAVPDITKLPAPIPNSSAPASVTNPLSASSVIDPMLEFSWSNQGGVIQDFPVMTDSLVDKLVRSDGDVVLSSLNASKNKKKEMNQSKNLVTPSSLLDMDENSSTASKTFSSSNFDLQMTPVKSSDLQVHPWTINTNSRDSIGLSGLLNTPQKVLPSDSEDSLDGLLLKNHNSSLHKILETNSDSLVRSRSPPGSFSPKSKKSSTSPSSKQRHISQDQNSTANFLAETEPEVDLQLQCMLNENSVDYISKFQDLVRQTTECDELAVIAADENARDGHLSPGASSSALCNLDVGPKEVKDNG